jgi:hypothetical protein
MTFGLLREEGTKQLFSLPYSDTIEVTHPESVKYLIKDGSNISHYSVHV